MGSHTGEEISLKWGCPRDSTSICLRLSIHFFARQSKEFAPAGAKCGFWDWFWILCWERQELSPHSRTRNAEQALPLSQGPSLPFCLTQKLKIPGFVNPAVLPRAPTAQTHLLEHRQWFSTKEQLSHGAHKSGCRATNLRSVRLLGAFLCSQPHKGAARAVFPSPLLHFCSNKSSPLLVSRRAANSLFHLYPAAPAQALL